MPLPSPIACKGWAGTDDKAMFLMLITSSGSFCPNVANSRANLSQFAGFFFEVLCSGWRCGGGAARTFPSNSEGRHMALGSFPTNQHQSNNRAKRH